MSDLAAEIDAAAEKFSLFGQHAEEALGRALARGMLKITAEAKRLAPKDTGHLAQSITQTPVEKQSDGRLAVTGGPTVAYGANVEFGTSPHLTNQGTEDFVLSITRWGRRKGMDERQILALIEHIRRHGTKPHPYLGPAWYSMIREVEADIKEAMSSNNSNSAGGSS